MHNTDTEKRRVGVREILFMPLGCLIQSSPFVVLIAVLILLFTGDYVFYNLNINLPGYASPDTSSWNISSGFEKISIEEGFTWEISYEEMRSTTFSGLVRHVSPIRENKFPMLSHDILVTSGDFSDPTLIKTSVNNHHFTWLANNQNRPQGTINLLHTVPINDEIRSNLTEIRNGQTVQIQGREIFNIRFYQDQQKWNYKWEDAGCNTLLVTSVEIISD